MEEINVNEIFDGETTPAYNPAESSEFFDSVMTAVISGEDKPQELSGPETFVPDLPVASEDSALNTENADGTNSVPETGAVYVDEIISASETAPAELATTEVKKEDEGFFFEPQNFVENLKYMGIGMLGIFVVIGIIMGVTAVLNKVFKD